MRDDVKSSWCAEIVTARIVQTSTSTVDAREKQLNDKSANLYKSERALHVTLQAYRVTRHAKRETCQSAHAHVSGNGRSNATT